MLDQNDSDFEIFLNFCGSARSIRQSLVDSYRQPAHQGRGSSDLSPKHGRFPDGVAPRKADFSPKRDISFPIRKWPTVPKLFAHFGFLAVVGRRAQQAVERTLAHRAVHRDQYIIDNRQFFEETDILECTR